MLKNKYIEDVPPNDKELERLLLGVLILQPKYINTASVDLFYPTANQQIFAKMNELHRKKIQISEPLLIHHLGFIPASYIASLTDGVYRLSGEQINAIVKQLKNLRTKRRLRVQVYQLYDALGKGQDMEAAQELIDKMKKEGGEEKDISQFTAKNIGKAFEIYRAKGEGVKMGLPSFDRITNGLAEGEVLYFLARPQVGKSIFAQNALRYFSINYPAEGAIFFSLEMSAPQLGERMFMIEGDKSKDEVREMTKAEQEVIVKQHKNIFYIDTAFMGLRDIYASVIKAQFKLKIRFVVIDFLTRIKTKVLKEYDALRYATTFIKDMAKELKVAIMVISQVSRDEGGGGYYPLRITAGRGSGTIEEDADFMLGAYRPELKPGLDPGEQFKVQNQLIIQLLKTRRTPPIPNIEVFFNKKNLRLIEMSKEE